jgi:hypothetical protein
MYIGYKEYEQIYDPIDEKTFNRISYDACRHIDKITTGIDGVKKLKIAFPTNEDAAEAVKRCTAAVINFLSQLDTLEKTSASVRGYSETANGLQGKVVSSISAGNESVSFSSGDTKTLVDVSVSDISTRDQVISNIVYAYLSGVADSNGVNLLYMGQYPL